MSEEIELRLLKENEELRQRLNKLEGKYEENLIPTFSFTSIKREDLFNLVDIKKSFNDTPFNDWLNNNIDISKENIKFLEVLLGKYGKFLKAYKEETLKANFIIPIINQVDFLSLEIEISPFYEEIITYTTDNFIFTGSTDFTVSKGLEYGRKPYFFIQEFKQEKIRTDPEPQLLAELISAVELNNWIHIKGAFIIGAIWNFVILEKLGKDKYQYFVSENFDSTKIEDLKGIYKNLMFIKNEIIEIVKKENN
jgi:hypothetical protein